MKIKIRRQSFSQHSLHRSTNYELVIVIEIPIVISEVIFGVETESGLRISPSRQAFE